MLETWNVIVSTYTSFKDDVLKTIPKLGPSFEGEIIVSNETLIDQG